MFNTLISTFVAAKASLRKARRSRYRPLTVERLESRDLFAGVVVSPVRGLNTSEDGGFAIVDFRLTEAPTADVIIQLSTSDAKEGAVGTPQVVFTPQNFNIVQRVRITGVADGVKDGLKFYQLITSNAISLDPAYDGLAVPDAELRNKDSRKLIAGVTVSKTRGLSTTEDGGTASFTLKLNFKPTANVLIPIASDNPNEGITSVESLVFTPDSFDQPQTVTVTGESDGIRDGNKTYHVVTGPATSADPLYNGLDAADVTLKNKDSKTLVAGVKVTPTKGLKTSEGGGAALFAQAGAGASFSIVLTYEPTANVTIPISSSNTAEGIPTVNSVTFTPQDWDVPQQVFVEGQDDGIFDGDVKYKILTGLAASADPLYANLDAVDVALTNLHREDVGRFDGIYVGSFTGTATETGFGSAPVSGSVRAEIRGGVVTVTDPGSGSGILGTTGGLGFGVTSGEVDGASFTGSLKALKGTSTASGKGSWRFSEPGVSAKGSWSIVRVSF